MLIGGFAIRLDHVNDAYEMKKVNGEDEEIANICPYLLMYDLEHLKISHFLRKGWK